LTTGAGSPGPTTNSPTGALLAEPAGGTVAPPLGEADTEGAAPELVAGGVVPAAESGVVEALPSVGVGVTGAPAAVGELSDEPLLSLLCMTLVTRKKATTTASTASTAI
jgi:hypothetical protein